MRNTFFRMSLIPPISFNENKLRIYSQPVLLLNCKTSISTYFKSSSQYIQAAPHLKNLEKGFTLLPKSSSTNVETLPFIPISMLTLVRTT